jgi:hypothetical protein
VTDDFMDRPEPPDKGFSISHPSDQTIPALIVDDLKRLADVRGLHAKSDVDAAERAELRECCDRIEALIRSTAERAGARIE